VAGQHQYWVGVITILEWGKHEQKPVGVRTIVGPCSTSALARTTPWNPREVVRNRCTDWSCYPESLSNFSSRSSPTNRPSA